MIEFDNTGFMNISPEPAAGIGMCRLVAQTDGEAVQRVDPYIGFSHRGIEKLMENRNLLQGLVLTDRLNRFAPFSCTHAFVLAAEKIAGVTVPARAKGIRVLMAEAGRILSHLRATANLAADTGTDSIYPIVRRTSSYIAGVIDEICQGCSSAVYIRFGGVRNDMAETTADTVTRLLTRDLPPVLAEIEDLLTENRIFKSRTQGVGVIGGEDALAAGFSGVNLRACGVKRDVRLAEPYELYGDLSFDAPLKTQGDCYARYLLRIFEIYQSMAIMRQIVENMPDGAFVADGCGVDNQDESLTELSRRFELYGKGMNLPAGEVYTAVESPLGEFGVYLVTDGTEKPYRCHFRSAGFPMLQALNRLTDGCDLSDIRVILSSLNLITTEIDR